jgi:hypothetical protein
MPPAPPLVSIEASPNASHAPSSSLATPPADRRRVRSTARGGGAASAISLPGGA